MQLQGDLPFLRAHGFGLAAVSYDRAAVLHDFAARRGITYPLLSDPDATVIRRFGVADRHFHKSDQLDIERETVYSGDAGFIPVYGLAYPSVFVIAPDRKVMWRFVSESAEFRLTGASILAHSVGIVAEANPASVAARHFPVTLTSSNARAALGNRILLDVKLQLPSGTHVYAPSAKELYRALDWKMDDSHHCWTASPVAYPEAVRKQFPFDPDPLPVYEGTVRLGREITVASAIKPQDPEVYRRFRDVCLDPESRLRIHGSLNVQACDDMRCFPPESIPLEWNIGFLPPDPQRVPEALQREKQPKE